MTEHPAGWVPEFEGQRPPFQPGHELSVTHGAYSPRIVDPIAKDLVDMMLEDSTLDYLKKPAFRPALWAWARAEAQAQLMTEYLSKAAEATGDGVGDLNAEHVRSGYLLLHRAEARADRSRARLGLDPLSRARLGKDVAAGAVDAAIVMMQLHELQESGQLPAVPPAEGTEGSPS